MSNFSVVNTSYNNIVSFSGDKLTTLEKKTPSSMLSITIKKTLSKKNDDNLSDIEKKKKKRKKIIFTTLGSSFLFSFFVSYLFSFGRSSLLRNELQKISAKSKSILNKSETNINGVRAQILDKVDKGSKICSNSTSLKDIVCEKIMNLTKLGKKIQQKITSLYSNINKKAVSSSLKNAKKSRENFIQAVENAIVAAKKDNSMDTVKINELEKLLIQEKLHGGKDFLSQENFDKICNIMREDMNYLKDNISIGKLLSKESLKGFVAEDILAERRNKFIAPLSFEKEKLTSNFENTSEYLGKRLLKTDLRIYSIEDKKISSKLSNISNQLHKNIKDYANSTPENFLENLKIIKGSLAELKQGINNLPTDSVARKNIAMQIEEYENILKHTKGGSIEQMRYLVTSMFGAGNSIDKAVRKTGKKYSRNLNNSLDKMINMFDKERDNVLGAGTTDILGLLIPAGTLAWTLKQKKEKDEKVGTIFEYGIPLIGSYAIYIYGLATQVNGFSSLVISGLSGLILNKIGTYVNKLYQNKKHKI